MVVDEAFRVAQSAEEAGDLVGAAAAFESYLDDADPLIAATARFHLGRVVWKRGQLDAALRLCEEARETAVKLQHRDLRAKVENAIGVLHVARGEYEQARAAYAVALDLTEDIVTRAKIALNLGVIANIQGRYDVARQQYARSETLFSEAADERGVALALHNIGMLHADRGEWDEADEAYYRALGLFESQGNKQMIANVLVNRSEVCYGRDRAHDAIANCDLALAMYAEVGDELGRGDALRWKGHGFRRLTRYAEAETVLADAMRIAERARARLLQAEVLREVGLVRRAMGRDAEATKTLQRAQSIFRDLGAERETAELTNLLGPQVKQS
ncbi:MAG: tetratricopeptide repeat protein [Gemmatimonadota bacterium]